MIRKVTTQHALEIIETREPKGLFYTMNNGIYVGIDNRSGDAWTEEFKTEDACLEWLMKGDGICTKNDSKPSTTY